jgi:uncharacterized membrane protein HdeD (DUF308 family)
LINLLDNNLPLITISGENNMNKKNFAMASLVLGILAVLTIFIDLFTSSQLLGIAGIILGILGIKSEKKSIAIWGIVLSALPILVMLFFLFMACG